METKNIKGQQVTIVSIAGDKNTITVNPSVVPLYEDPHSVRHVQDIIAPLRDEGYESITFENGEDSREIINKSDAVDILDIEVEGVTPGDVLPPQEMDAWITIYAPIFDPEKTKWRFDVGNGHIEHVDISETTIASDAMRRGKVSVGDTYLVRLEIEQYRTVMGSVKAKYKVHDVKEFREANSSVSQKYLFKS